MGHEKARVVGWWFSQGLHCAFVKSTLVCVCFTIVKCLFVGTTCLGSFLIPLRSLSPFVRRGVCACLLLAILYLLGNIFGAVFGLYLQAPKEHVHVTELAQRLEYGNYGLSKRISLWRWTLPTKRHYRGVHDFLPVGKLFSTCFPPQKVALHQ